MMVSAACVVVSGANPPGARPRLPDYVPNIRFDQAKCDEADVDTMRRNFQPRASEKPLSA
jgi:hypothetical protein